ncbi:unnamed protein product [Protopolystoma xenopodis]|uniref:Uncharacterized protein n=1 Tax=Protopolystoma xenopodis TaxID=117903 RepID=A0A448WXS9_9PLAT|nr:unnamed protein product [Protopolystoma xenopodis]
MHLCYRKTFSQEMSSSTGLVSDTTSSQTAAPPVPAWIMRASSLIGLATTTSSVATLTTTTNSATGSASTTFGSALPSTVVSGAPGATTMVLPATAATLSSLVASGSSPLSSNVITSASATPVCTLPTQPPRQTAEIRPIANNVATVTPQPATPVLDQGYSIFQAMSSQQLSLTNSRVHPPTTSMAGLFSFLPSSPSTSVTCPLSLQTHTATLMPVRRSSASSPVHHSSLLLPPQQQPLAILSVVSAASSSSSSTSPVSLPLISATSCSTSQVTSSLGSHILASPSSSTTTSGSPVGITTAAVVTGKRRHEEIQLDEPSHSASSLPTSTTVHGLANSASSCHLQVEMTSVSNTMGSVSPPIATLVTSASTASGHPSLPKRLRQAGLACQAPALSFVSPLVVEEVGGPLSTEYFLFDFDFAFRTQTG